MDYQKFFHTHYEIKSHHQTKSEAQKEIIKILLFKL